LIIGAPRDRHAKVLAPRLAAPHWKVGPVLDLLRGAAEVEVEVELDPHIAAAGPDVNHL
jgi:hypothetical protein